MTQFHQELGRLYMKVEAWEKAVIVFEKLIEFDSVTPQVYIALVQALIKLEYWQDAVQIYRQIIHLNVQSQFRFSLTDSAGKSLQSS
jgi:tetratricopeptide (TPR) repeat protein